MRPEILVFDPAFNHGIAMIRELDITTDQSRYAKTAFSVGCSKDVVSEMLCNDPHKTDTPNALRL